MEEARSLLDSAERGKRQIEGELAESRNAVNEMNTINSKASAEKRHVEGLVHTMHAEIDDMLQQAKNSEEKAKKAMVDAARLADELRAEQDHVNTQSKAKRSLESQLLELENRLAEANENAIRGGRAAMAKLENRIRELVKELGFQIDEDKKNQDRMSELATKLQQKIKTYKKQIEEAEEIAALNLAKYRKAQQELEEAEERGKLAEGALGLLRQTRGGSIF